MKFSFGSKKSKTVEAENAASAPVEAAEISPNPKEKPKRQKGTRKNKTVNFLRHIRLPKRREFVLFLGDEGAILVLISQQGLEGRWYASSPLPENLDVFEKALVQHPRAPLTIILDTMDQHFAPQTLPPVGKMSISGLLKRRTQREFGRKIDIKGHYFLSRSANKEWNYMIYAADIGEMIRPWFDWVASLPNPPAGIRLLPLESEIFVNALVQLNQSGVIAPETPLHQWHYLLSYNKASGVRQVILKDGKMVFTRLGQSLEGDASTEAGAIEQEVSSTVEYLKRIGLRGVADIHLYAICGQDIINAMDTNRMGITSYTLYTPYQLSEQLGWDNVSQPEDRFGDIVLATFGASYKKSKHILWTKQLGNIHRLFVAVPAMRIASVAIVLGSLAFGGYKLSEYLTAGELLAQQNEKKQRIEQEIEQREAKTDLTPEKLQQTLEIYQVYRSVKENQINPKNFLMSLSWGMQDLPKHMRVQAIKWEKAELPKEKQLQVPQMSVDELLEQSRSGVQVEEKRPTEIPQGIGGTLSINILVPSNIKSEALEQRAQSVLNKLQPYLPEYEFKLTGLPGAKGSDDEINIDFEEEAPATEQLKRITVRADFTGVEYITDLSIKGEIK